MILNTTFIDDPPFSTNLEVSKDNWVNDYNMLNGRPSIEGHILEGNITLDDLGAQPKGDYALKSELVGNISQATIDKYRLLGLNSLSVSTYVTKEADRVAQNIKVSTPPNSLRLAFASDFHNYSGNQNYSHPDTRTSMSCMDTALIELRRQVDIDGFVALGDYSWMESNYTTNQVKKDINEVMELLPVNNIDKYYCIGNHDINYGAGRDRLMTQEELYDLLGSKSNYITNPSDPHGCYGYKDFEAQKIRIIFLNSIDVFEWKAPEGSFARAEWLSQKQLQWFADIALNFDMKADPSEWGVVICSHHPLDDWNWAEVWILKILEGYRAGTKETATYSIDEVNHTVSYDFTNKPKRAEIICQIHGHNHNFNTRKISSGSTVNPWLRRFCIGNASANRYNEVATSSSQSYKERFGEFDSAGKPIYHRKSTGTAKETSFCIVSIDRTVKKIYAHCFGAGKDRVFSYDAETFNIKSHLTNVTAAPDNSTTIQDNQSVTLKFTASPGYDLPLSVNVVGATYKWTQNTGSLLISNPTSEVIVTISGITQPKYTNQIPLATDKDGKIYNGKGFKENTYISSSLVDGHDAPETSRAGTNLTGFIPFGMGSSQEAKGEWVLRFKNLTFDKTQGNTVLRFYDANKDVQFLKSSTNMTSAMPKVTEYKLEGNNYVEIDCTGITAWADYAGKKPIKYIRVNAPNITENSVITVNELIE